MSTNDKASLVQGIVGRLREQAAILAANTGGGEYLDEAADEIERLQGALVYLMQMFDMEVHYCEVCGKDDPTADCDSANWLRSFLTPNAKLSGAAKRPLE